jgi:hypothetical protein
LSIGTGLIGLTWYNYRRILIIHKDEAENLLNVKQEREAGENPSAFRFCFSLIDTARVCRLRGKICSSTEMKTGSRFYSQIFLSARYLLDLIQPVCLMRLPNENFDR